MNPLWLLAAAFVAGIVVGYFLRVALDRVYLHTIERGHEEVAERLALRGLTSALDKLDRKALRLDAKARRLDETARRRSERPEVTH